MALIDTNAAALAALPTESVGSQLTHTEWNTLTSATKEANAATRAANTFYAGPPSGAAASGAFRAIVAADLSGVDLSATYLTPAAAAAAYQPLHAALTAVAGLSTTGAMFRTGSNTFAARSIVNADIDAAAAIAYSKLNLTGAILDADIVALAATKLTGTIPDARFPATLPALSGVNLTALNASNLGSGTVPDARFPATLPAVSGVNLTALNATNLGSGTVPDARFPAALPAISGANLTNINATNIASGSLADARFPTGFLLDGSRAGVSAATTGDAFSFDALSLTSGVWMKGRVPASGFTGSIVRITDDAGSPATLFEVDETGAVTTGTWNATAVPWAKVNKTGSSLADLATRSAADLATGTLPDGRFPATLPAASGVNLTALNATNLGSGTVPTARLGSGTADSTTFLRGDNTWAVPSGGGSGATTALDNLASVAINTSLLPGTAGSPNLGSATKPFGTVNFAGTSGTPGTNNFSITGASTSGTRTVTFPDASITVAGIGLAQTWTATQTHSSPIVISAGSAAAAGLQTNGNAGTGLFSTLSGYLNIAASSIFTAIFGPDLLQFRSSGALNWSSASADGTAVVGLIRSATGVLKITNGSSGFGSLIAGVTDAGTTTATDALTADHASSGTPAAGFGSSVLFRGQSTTQASQDMARIAAVWTTATHASRTSKVQIFNVTNAGALASCAEFDMGAATDDIGLFLWDFTAGTLKRVSRGVSDSGGAGFRLLRVAN